MSILVQLVRLLRPAHLIKNLFVFIPWLFARRFGTPQELWQLLLVFLLFSLTAGAIYIFNDILDLEEDRLHPLKKMRPLAAGAIGSTLAGWTGFLVLIVALGAGFLVGWRLGVVLATYALLNLLYSRWLKRVAFLDLLLVSTGFVLREVAGAWPLGIYISPWLITATYFLTLLIVVTKREMALRVAGEEHPLHTDSVYTIPFLRDLELVLTPMLLVVYVLYTYVRINSDWFVVTVPIVLYTVFRYLYITRLQTEVDSPVELLYRDGPLFTGVLLWLASAVAILGLGI
ncbi:MAG: UbiA family prenyltransferase [Candidatus Delongbacteria bacterium]|nr:UbiA family prenyltransferase [Candidatus Delongbacteria bacterium]